MDGIDESGSGRQDFYRQEQEARISRTALLRKRHGLITGATGTGKTVTLQVLG